MCTGVGWGFQPHFHDSRSRSGKSERLAILKETAGEILVNKDVLCCFVLPGERADVMLLVDMECSLVFMTQLPGLIKVDLYIENKVTIFKAIDVERAILGCLLWTLLMKWARG